MIVCLWGENQRFWLMKSEQFYFPFAIIVRFLEGEEHYRALCDELQKVHLERKNIGKKNLSHDEG